MVRTWGGGRGGGILPYFSYMGMCHLIGHGVRGAQGILFGSVDLR